MRDPFPEVSKIISIASGVVGDDKVSCYKAREILLASVAKIIGLRFNNILFKRADKVVPL